MLAHCADSLGGASEACFGVGIRDRIHRRDAEGADSIVGGGGRERMGGALPRMSERPHPQTPRMGHPETQRQRCGDGRWVREAGSG